eukprot:Em0034g24a
MERQQERFVLSLWRKAFARNLQVQTSRLLQLREDWTHSQSLQIESENEGGKVWNKEARQGKANVVSADAEESEIDILAVEPVKKSKPIMAMVRLEGKVLEMEVDTGAAITLVSERTFMKLWGNKRLLQPSTIQLKTFTGERIRVLGAMEVVVEHNSQKKKLELFVVQGHGPSLL